MDFETLVMNKYTVVFSNSDDWHLCQKKKWTLNYCRTFRLDQSMVFFFFPNFNQIFSLRCFEFENLLNFNYILSLNSMNFCFQT